MPYDIEDWREDQYKEYQNSLKKEEPKELCKCAGCYEETADNELHELTMNSINYNRKLRYCKPCIDFYLADK